VSRVKSNRVYHLCLFQQDMPIPDITRSPSLRYTETLEGDEGSLYFDYSKNIVDNFVPQERADVVD
jgi:hypothetical protein